VSGICQSSWRPAVQTLTLKSEYGGSGIQTPERLHLGDVIG